MKILLTFLLITSIFATSSPAFAQQDIGTGLVFTTPYRNVELEPLVASGYYGVSVKLTWWESRH